MEEIKKETVPQEQLITLSNKVDVLEQHNLVLLDAINKINEGIEHIISVSNQNFEAIIRYYQP